MELPEDLKDASAMLVMAFKRDANNPKQGYFGMHLLFDESENIACQEDVDDIKSHILTGAVSCVENDFHNVNTGGEFLMVMTQYIAAKFPEVILHEDLFNILKTFKNVSDAIDENPTAHKIQDAFGEFEYEDGRNYQLQVVAVSDDSEKIQRDKIRISSYEKD
jgi:hypothetical protein